MKDLQLSDIFQKASEITTKISVYEDGEWRFISLDPFSNIKTFQNQTFYRINQVFGLLRQEVSDPSKFSVKGEAGQFVGVSPSGRLYKLTVEEYKSIFPIPVVITESKNYNSEKLKDPKFITKIVKGSDPTSSNSTMAMPSKAAATSNKYYNPPKVSSGCGCKN